MNFPASPRRPTGQFGFLPAPQPLGRTVARAFVSLALVQRVELEAEAAAEGLQDLLDLSLEWRRRDTNEEADALTNECFDAFDPALRLDAARAATSFLCLRELEVATREWRRERHARATGP